VSKPRIGVQLIIYGQRPTQDPVGVLREIHQAGYEGIEGGNLFDLGEPSMVKSLIRDSGLAVAGAHSGFADAESPARVEANITYLKEMGARYLICSGVAAGEGIERYEKAAPVFNALGKRCKEAGLVFCYHNHNWEFEEFNGIKGIHRLCELTDPDLVKLCIDVYWVTIGGEKPAEFIARYANRAPYYHFKDGGPGVFKELGQGQVDLKAATKAALATNPEWIVCEQDRTDKNVAQSITESRTYMREALGL
jgi:sugar phosphate isomerase/epimerase